MGRRLDRAQIVSCGLYLVKFAWTERNVLTLVFIIIYHDISYLKHFYDEISKLMNKGFHIKGCHIKIRVESFCL
jgi:hypothetical protein